MSAELKELEPELAEAETALTLLLASTPNLPHPSAPDGFTDEDAVEVRRLGDPPRFDFEPKDHAELGAALGMLDVERGARTSGSRFVYLLGDLVFVQFALMRNAMDVPRRARLHAVDPAGPRARGSDVRLGVPPDR